MLPHVEKNFYVTSGSELFKKNYENTYFKNLIMFSSKGKRKVKNEDALQMNFLRGSIFHVL